MRILVSGTSSIYDATRKGLSVGIRRLLNALRIDCALATAIYRNPRLLSSAHALVNAADWMAGSSPLSSLFMPGVELRATHKPQQKQSGYG